jgi:hypothetical protein
MTFDTITRENKTNPSFIRASQRSILPGGVKSRNLSNIIYGSEEANASTSLSNGEQAYVSLSISQNQKYEILGHLYTSIYIGSISVATQLPGGSSIDESQWQVIGPFYDYQNWSEQYFPKHEEYAVLYIRNISAGASTTVYISSKWRYFSPQEPSS